MAVYWCVWCGNVRAGGPSKRPGSCVECAKSLRYMIARVLKHSSANDDYRAPTIERVNGERAESRYAS